MFPCYGKVLVKLLLLTGVSLNAFHLGEYYRMSFDVKHNKQHMHLSQIENSNFTNFFHS